MFNRKPAPQTEPEIIFEGRRLLDESSFPLPEPARTAEPARPPVPLADTLAAPLPVPPGPPMRDLGPAIPGTVIGADTVLEGTIRAAGNLRIEGSVTGTVIADRVAVGEEGRVEGAIEAGSVRIAGEVKGSVSAREIDVLRAARVDADMSYAEIAIERGARVRGVHKQRDETPPSPQASYAAPIDSTTAQAAAVQATLERTVIGLDDLKSRMAQLAETAD